MLCPRKCIISEDKYGFCNCRINTNERLYSAVYAKPASLAVDPIEKKPLYHFLPKSKAFSIGTIGCNLSCLFCQNYSISRAKADEINAETVLPEKIVELALEAGCESIAYTYN